jgi:hypothetical protein
MKPLLLHTRQAIAKEAKKRLVSPNPRHSDKMHEKKKRNQFLDDTVRNAAILPPQP